MTQKEHSSDAQSPVPSSADLPHAAAEAEPDRQTVDATPASEAQTVEDTDVVTEPELETQLFKNPVRDMMLLAALWLPLGFFFWYVLASGLMKPASMLTEALLTGLYPEFFERIVQLGFMFEVHTAVLMPQQVQGQQALLNLDINPLIYAWGLPLLFGLVMATPLRVRQRVLQLFIGFVLVTLLATWGVFWEIWRDLTFLMPAPASELVAQTALTPTMIALCYQLGFLLFPGVIPIAAWILMNRPFIERLVETRAS